MTTKRANTGGARVPHAGDVSLLVAAFRIRGFSLQDDAPERPADRAGESYLRLPPRTGPRPKVHETPELSSQDSRVVLGIAVATIGRMATLFTKIINGEIPGRFVWRDDRVVAFLTIAPLKPGHVLVVPIEEVDHWLDLDPDLLAHLVQVSQTIGRAVDQAFAPVKVGMMIAGLEVPHVHVHIVPMSGVRDLDFANADPDPSAESLDGAAEKIRLALAAFDEDGGHR